MAWLKKIIYLLSGLVIFSIVIVLIAVVAIHFVDENKYKASIIQLLNDISGQQIVVNGPIEINLLPMPNMLLNDVSLTINLDDQPAKVHAKTAKFRMPFMTFWANQLNKQFFDLRDISLKHSLSILENPLNIKSVRGVLKTSCCSVVVDDMNIQVDSDTKLKGHFHLSLLSERPKLEGQFTLSDWSFREVNTSSRNVFSPEKFDFSALEQVDLDLSIKVGKLSFNRLHFLDNHFTVNNNNASLQVEQRAKLWKGDWEGSYNINAKGVHQLKWDVQLKDAQASQWVEELYQAKKASNGVVNIKSTGNSRGNSIKAWASTAMGKVDIGVNDLVILEPHFNTSIGGVVFDTIGGALQKQRTEISCMVGRFSINKGIVSIDDSFGFETTEVAGVANGKINLGSERLDVDLHLIPKPSLVDITEMTQSAHIGGTLSDPEVSIKSSNLIKQGGSLMLGIFTGGLSIVAQNIFKHVSNNGEVCEAILNE